MNASSRKTNRVDRVALCTMFAAAMITAGATAFVTQPAATPLVGADLATLVAESANVGAGASCPHANEAVAMVRPAAAARRH